MPEGDLVLALLPAEVDLLAVAQRREVDEAALEEAGPTNGGGAAGRVVSEAFLELQRALGELQAMEIVLRDLDRGLVDFPALREGREIYLCWEEGEDEIAFWHDTDTGFAGRQPL